MNKFNFIDAIFPSSERITEKKSGTAERSEDRGNDDTRLSDVQSGSVVHGTLLFTGDKMHAGLVLFDTSPGRRMNTLTC
jgi:hypothetical protein